MVFWLSIACTLWTGTTVDVPATVVRLQGSGVLLEHPGVEGWKPAGQDEVETDPNLARRLEAGDEITARLLVRDGEVRLIGASER